MSTDIVHINNRRLRALKTTHSLTNRQLCELLSMPATSGRGASNSTLDAWLGDVHPMPLRSLRLLELELSILTGDAHARTG